jgi:rhamnosyltransferase
MTPWIVLRSHNDGAHVGDTLAGLRRQTVPFRLLAIDNASTDGTREMVAGAADAVVDIPDGAYVPGPVLNLGMERTDGELVVFLNADCTPADDRWLERLLDGMRDDNVAAAFSRQRPRTDCLPLLARDTEDTFGDGTAQARWRHCFSMAASVIRRSVWTAQPFDETLQYSEDIDWTWRARRRGWSVRYVPTSAVFHSHNYTLRQSWRRHLGEGRAEAQIFDWTRWDRSWLRYVLLPLSRRVIADWRYCVARRDWRSALGSPLLRGAQLLGRRRGFLAGWRARAPRPAATARVSTHTASWRVDRT